VKWATLVLRCLKTSLKTQTYDTRLVTVDIAKSLLPPEVVIGDGVELVATGTLAEVELTLAALGVVVALEYTTGATAGAL
jgi:hypothetical protein